MLSFFIIKNDIINLFFHFVSDVISLFHQKDEFREDIVFIDDFSKLWEVPRVPLLQSHNKSINILIKLLNQSDCLDNWFVLPVNIGGALGSRETMAQTQLGSGHVLVRKLLHDFHEVSSNSSVQLDDGVVESGRKASRSEKSIIKEQNKSNIRAFVTLNRSRAFPWSKSHQHTYS